MMKKKALSGIIAGTLSISLITSMSPTTYLTQVYADSDKDAYIVTTTEEMSIQTTTAATQTIESTTTTTAIITAISEEQAKLDELTKKENRLFGEFQRERAILSGKLAPDAERLTLDDANEIINRCNSYDEIYKELATAQTYPDFIGGSGVTKIEYWFDDNGYQKLLLIHEEGDVIYVQCNDAGKITDWNLLFPVKKDIPFESYQAKMIGSFNVYNDINASDTITTTTEEVYTGTQTTEPIQTTTTTTTTSQPKDEKQEQLDKLTEKENILFGDFQRERAVISGEFDPNTTRLTLDKVNEIINSADSFDDMYRELAASQKYADFIGGSGVTKVEYWLDDTGSEKIRLIVEENDIVYVKFDDKGYIMDWQALYRENNVVNLEQYKAQMIGSYMIYNDIDASGDINCDGDLSISDVVMFQRWLLGVPDTDLVNWKAADFCKDNKLNVFDLALMKRELIYNK